MENGKAKQLLDRIQDIVGEGQNVPFAAGKVLVNKEEVLESFLAELEKLFTMFLISSGNSLFFSILFNLFIISDISLLIKSPPSI